MQRSRPLRRTPIRNRGKGLSRTTPLNPVSRKQARRNTRWAKVKAAVLERDGHRCQMCGTTPALDVHHKRGRVGEDLVDVSLLVTVCRTCHDFIEEHRAWAYRTGWLVRRNAKDSGGGAA